MPATPVMNHQLKLIWSEVLDLDNAEVEDEMNFFDLDGDSVKPHVQAIQVVAAAAVQNLLFSVDELYMNPTIAALSSYLEERPAQTAETSSTKVKVPTSDGDDLEICHPRSLLSAMEKIAPVTPIQGEFLYLHETGKIPLSVFVYELRGTVDEDTVSQAVSTMAANNSILRTTWAQTRNGYCQVLLRDPPVQFSVFDGRVGDHIAASKAIFVRPGEPTARFSLVREADGSTFFTIAIHHAFCDAFTRYLLEAGFIQALRAPERVEPGIERPWYGDFARFLHAHQDKVKIRNYWKSYIDGSSVETVCPGPLVPASKAKTLKRTLPALGCQRYQVSASAVVVTAWCLALAGHCGLRDFVLGMIKLGRNYPYPGLGEMSGCVVDGGMCRFRFPRSDESLEQVLLDVHQELSSHALYEHGLGSAEWREIAHPQCLLNIKLGTNGIQPTTVGNMTVVPRRDLEYWDILFTNSIYLDVSQEGAGIAMKIWYRSEHINDQAAASLLQRFSTVLAAMGGRDVGLADLVALVSK